MRMKDVFQIDKWKVIQKGFDNDSNEIAESITSLGNGHMGFRGNFEEDFSGNTLKGIYVAGIYYPDKTKVGWWKIGYPEYFAKVLNSCDFLSLSIRVDNELVDINKCDIKDFVRELDMKRGILSREFTLITKENKQVHIKSERFVSMKQKEVGVLKYTITPLCDDIKISIESIINGDVRNTDSNYDEMFWSKQNVSCDDNIANITMSTKKTNMWVSSTILSECYLDNNVLSYSCDKDDLSVRTKFKTNIKVNEVAALYKYFAVTTSMDYSTDNVADKSINAARKAKCLGYDALLDEHVAAWDEIWAHSDVIIKGDESAQQGIRFNIFHLNQTYTGHDSRFNIGPKGFTGEKYGGSTYWDTESFCLPFFLSTANEKVPRNLLIYRYNHLEKAKENANKLGLKGALYPMVTMNGEECHNEWEITFEEIHRNTAITHAIYNYVNYTGDKKYLVDYGIYVLYETSRFWASRVNYNPRKKKYMILGVTGPNEYENNVNNNYHTNNMAAFSLKYTYNVAMEIKRSNPESYVKAVTKMNITDSELDKFVEIADNMYLPYIEEYEVFSQQDGYIDKELSSVDDLSPEERPINQNWSWDKILRSCFIKQADVLQSIYNFPFDYDAETKKRNFDFYEPKTVHESSLSPCIYSIIASEIGYDKKAYELYLRASRLDLDNYNNDTEDGLHITSMAGTWLAIVHGFGGLRVKNDKLMLNPKIPENWDEYSFKLYYRGKTLQVTVDKSFVEIDVVDSDRVNLYIYNRLYQIISKEKIKLQ